MVATAVELLAVQGARPTGVREVIASSGAPRGSFQHYFPGGKRQLVGEAVAIAAGMPTAIVQRVAERGGSARDAVRDTVAWWARRLRATDFGAGCPLAAVSVDGSLADERTRTAVWAAFQGWADALTVLLEQDGRGHDQAQQLAVLIISGVEGAIVLSRAARSLEPLHAVGRGLANLLAPAPADEAFTTKTPSRRAIDMSELTAPTDNAFLTASGLVIDELSGTRVRGHLDLGPQHHTPWGVVHGGVFTTAVESAGSLGASEAVKDRGQFAVGVHNATDFLRPSTGGRAELVAEPVQQGRVQQLWSVVITSDAGKELARGQLRLQNVALPDHAGPGAP